jgi:hypothetical protein
VVTPLHGGQDRAALQLPPRFTGNPEEITAQQAQDAFSVIGLDPMADADLVELAYWHQVDVCRATLLGSPAWRGRMAELNQARALLSHIAPSPNSDLEHAGSSAAGMAAMPGVAAAFLPPLALMVFIVLTRGMGWDRGAIAAGGFAVLALSAFVGLVMMALSGRHQPAAVGAETNPYRLLRVLPSADQSLVTIAYRHALRVASARQDSNALDALEAAYARLGTPAARTAYDLRSAEADAMMLSEPAAPAPSSGRGRSLQRRLAGSGSRLVASLRPLARARRTTGTVDRPVASWEAIDAEDGLPPLRSRAASEPSVQPIGTLRVLDDDDEVVTVVLRDATVYGIGSDAESDVRLPATEDVAAEHARLTVRRGRVLFHHLDRNSDSYVNGERAVWAVLEPGDTLRIGGYRCQYLSPAEPRVPALRDLPRE